MYPLLIADSGGTKTDWCFINSVGNKQFFTTESYHPQNWSEDFLLRIKAYWGNHADFKNATLHFFCAGCFQAEKANQLVQIFNNLGFLNVTVKSDLHAAALSLYGNNDGFCAILGTGSVFFEWKHNEVTSISGGKGHQSGDQGSGYFFGKLIYHAWLENKLSSDQKIIFEKKVNVLELKESTELFNTKKKYSELAIQLSENNQEFADWHLININSFFDDVWKTNEPLQLRIVGGYFAANSKLFKPYLAEKEVYIQEFNARPIESLVDYFMRLAE